MSHGSVLKFSLLLTLGLTTSTLFATASPISPGTSAAAPNAATKVQFGNTDITDVEVANIHHAGKLLLRKIKVNESTVVNGFLEAQGCMFKHSTTVNGHILASDSQFNDLTIYGRTEFKNVTVLGPSVIQGQMVVDHGNFENTLLVSGQLSAKDSAFAKTLTVSSNTTDFENCTLQNIVIQRSSDNKAQTISLKGTKVVGTIKFEGGNGIVKVDGASTYGHVTGGIIQK